MKPPYGCSNLHGHWLLSRIYVGGLDPGEHAVLAVVDTARADTHVNGTAAHALRLVRYAVVELRKGSEGLITDFPLRVLAFEGQDLGRRQGKGKHRARPQDILKLAMRAGAQAQRVVMDGDVDRVVQLPVKVWKNQVMPAQGEIAKEQFCNRIWAALSEHEQKMVEALGDNLRMDALDAIGIAWAVGGMHDPELQKYTLGWKDGFG